MASLKVCPLSEIKIRTSEKLHFSDTLDCIYHRKDVRSYLIHFVMVMLYLTFKMIINIIIDQMWPPSDWNFKKKK